MRRLAAMICAPLLLAACGSGGSGGSSDPMVGCIMQIQPPGTYDYAAGTKLPVATPGPGGTQAGADALNACARERVFGNTAVAASVAAEMQSPTSVAIRDGGLPHNYAQGSSDGTVVAAARGDGAVIRKYTYGTPPSSHQNAVVTPRASAIAPSPVVRSSASCPANAPVIYGGASYCFR
ncbi:hypothetical protein FIU97_01330 [Roseivivax sp. THAF40]|uniref:hypothetical protein n=1 Tax=unclassified Roseivivax TaxID=2639302 RepID=UPI001268A9C7|nr:MULTISPECIES: hypothetical protein [unclassified Roseivivax]QFS81475.1 hypothetical protein FIV09_01420 [Roseivivax sp. THAF197b]QFT45204.1 hypothetical protein FIU97_01330 [Roseivivax sp. THAF40]